MADKPLRSDYVDVLLVLRELLVSLNYVTQEKDQKTRLELRGLIQDQLLHSIETLDLYLTRSIEKRGTNQKEDFGGSFGIVSGAQEVWEVPLSDGVSILTIRWPVPDKDVVECYIPKNKWRSLVRWKMINTPQSQPTEFEYPDGK